MHQPFTRPRTTLDLHAPGGLARLFAQTRSEFGGHRMSAPAPEAAPAAPADGGQQQAPTPQAGQEQQPAPQTGQTAGEAADLEPREGEDYAALLRRVGPEGVAKLALRYRNEAGDRRQQTRAAEQTAEQKATEAANTERQKLLDQLKPGLVALGLIKDDETPDPAKLTGDLQTRTAELEQQRVETRTLQIENAVLLAAPGLQANAAKLLDSRSFAKSVASLDPSADDFAGKVKAAIEAAVKNDSSLKVARAASSAGMAHVGGSGGQQTGRPLTSLEAAVGNALNPTT